jgi:hypothetical protein
MEVKMRWQSEIYSKMCTIKPDIRDILWAYERDHDLGKAVNKMGEVLDNVWNYAIEQAADCVESPNNYDIPGAALSDEVRELRTKS